VNLGPVAYFQPSLSEHYRVQESVDRLSACVVSQFDHTGHTNKLCHEETQTCASPSVLAFKVKGQGRIHPLLFYTVYHNYGISTV